MLKEISVAMEFLSNYLSNKLPRRRVEQLLQTLQDQLRAMYEGHWYADDPEKGSGYRCLKFDDSLDPLVRRCAKESGVVTADILHNLPPELHVWIDPDSVCFRSGERSPLQYLFHDGNTVETDLPRPRSELGIDGYELECSPFEGVIPCTHFKLDKKVVNVNPKNLSRPGGKIILDSNAVGTAMCQDSLSSKQVVPLHDPTQTGKL
jgi:protein Tob/BTG